MESDTEPEFYTRWVRTPADSPDNVAPTSDFDSGVHNGIAIYLTDAEYDTALAASARQKRDRLKTYRQALRDIPEQAGFPRTITWPEKP